MSDQQHDEQMATAKPLDKQAVEQVCVHPGTHSVLAVVQEAELLFSSAVARDFAS